MGNRKPWYLTKSQWVAQQAQDAHWAAVAEQRSAEAASRPAVPPGIAPVVWARMTEVEQAQAWVSHRQHEEAMASQHRTRMTLGVIFVVIPVAVLLIVLVFVAVSQMGS